jgi:hypothetical protein
VHDGACVPASVHAQITNANKPNVVLIMTDEHDPVVARSLPAWSVVAGIVQDLITYLESVSDEEQGKAQEAADLLRRSLGDPQEPGDTRGFHYDLGGKGIHDWAWNPTNERQIASITDRYWDLFVSKEEKPV